MIEVLSGLPQDVKLMKIRLDKEIPHTLEQIEDLSEQLDEIIQRYTLPTT